MNQVEKILELTGIPSEDETKRFESPYAKIMIECVSIFKRVELREICQGACSNTIDFMKSLMNLNPQKRCSAELALRHPFVSDCHDPKSEYTYPYGSIQVRPCTSRTFYLSQQYCHIYFPFL